MSCFVWHIEFPIMWDEIKRWIITFQSLTKSVSCFFWILLSRLPAVWSNTSPCVPASVAAHQQHIWRRFRGPRALAPAVSSTSAQTARSPSTAPPPAEWWSPDPTSPAPKQPRSYQAALAARGASGACDGALLRFLFTDCFNWVGQLSLDWQCYRWLPPMFGRVGKAFTWAPDCALWHQSFVTCPSCGST